MFEKYFKPLKLKERFSKEKFSIGLDIGTSAIKLIKLKFSEDTAELDRVAFEPAGADPKGALKKIAESCDMKRVNLSVCGSSTLIRYVNFPQMSPDELRQALKFEAGKYIPFPMDEINLDSCILRERSPEGKMWVMLAAVKKELVNQRLKLIKDAGFQGNLVDVDSVALINVFKFNYSQDEGLKQKSVALLNVGALMSNLSILEDNLPVLSRDIYIAGNSFTSRLKEIFNIDFNRAEELKVYPDKEGADKICSALEAAVSNLANEIRASFDYYESQGIATVSKIYLSGGSSKLLRLKEMLANLIGMEVEVWNPLQKIKISSGADSDRIKEQSSQMAVALGLALRQ